jgi:hypothetical protein
MDLADDPKQTHAVDRPVAADSPGSPIAQVETDAFCGGCGYNLIVQQE